MKKLILITIIAFLTSFSSSFAQGSSLNIAVINAEEVLRNSVVMKHIQDKISSKEKEYQSMIDVKQKVLEKEFKKIDSKKSVLSTSSLEEEEEKFNKKFNDLKVELESKQKSLKDASIQALSQVDEKVNEIIATISKEKNLDLILHSSSLIFAKDDLDISDEVLKRLNKQMTKVKINFN